MGVLVRILIRVKKNAGLKPVWDSGISTAIRYWRLSVSCPIKGPLETPPTSGQYGAEGLKGAHQLGPYSAEKWEIL